MKAGDRVKVDFISESRTIYSGKRFTGYGVLDRVEDGRVFGRLDDEFWFHRNVKLLSGKMSKRYESACKCCYSIRYRPERVKGTNNIRSKHERVGV